MTNGMSDYLQNTIINHVIRNTITSAGSSTWLALYTSNPTRADTGTEVTSGSGYARAFIKQQVGTDPPWVLSGDGAGGTLAYNSYRIDFPTPTGDWGTITHWGLRDASVGGNLYYYGELTTGSGLIHSGNDVIIFPGRLELTYPGAYLSANILNHFLNNISYTTPGSSVYGALYFTMPSSSGSGGIEVSGSGYNRPQIINWSAPSSGSTQNISGSIVFCTNATGSWSGEVAGMCLQDAPTGGNILYRFSTIYGASIYLVREGDKFAFNEKIIELHLDYDVV